MSSIGSLTIESRLSGELGKPQIASEASLKLCHPRSQIAGGIERKASVVRSLNDSMKSIKKSDFQAVQNVVQRLWPPIEACAKKIAAPFLPSRPWNEIKPCLMILGGGIAISSAFRRGILAGAISVVVENLISKCALAIFPLKSDPDSKYLKLLMATPLINFAIWVPLGEECIFRGGLQWYFTNEYHSPIAGIALSAILFGAVHLTNDHQLRHMQAISAGIFGITAGILKQRFGMLAPIAMHMANNFLILC